MMPTAEAATDKKRVRKIKLLQDETKIQIASK